MKHPLVELEERGAQALTSGDAVEFYRTCLTDDTLMVVPGFVVDRATFLEALAREAPWLSFQVEEPRVVELTQNCAVVQYRGRGRRQGQPEYVALMSSIYVNKDGSWKLAYHQQTPTPIS